MGVMGLLDSSLLERTRLKSPLKNGSSSGQVEGGEEGVTKGCRSKGPYILSRGKKSLQVDFLGLGRGPISLFLGKQRSPRGVSTNQKKGA